MPVSSERAQLLAAGRIPDVQLTCFNLPTPAIRLVATNFSDRGQALAVGAKGNGRYLAGVFESDGGFVPVAKPR
jgi:hypothetical protein